MSSDSSKSEEVFAAYAEKHELFDLFHNTLSKLLIARPLDPFQYLIDSFAKKQEARTVILIAPPISNLKETVEMVVTKLDVVHISTGTLLERAYQKQTASGIQAKAYVDKGQLVPDHIVTAMVLQQLKEPDVIERGYLLDGFPRTKQQAMSLVQAGFIPDHILDIEVDDQVVLQRAVGLRYDPITSEVFNIQDSQMGRVSLADATVRSCDTMESIKERLSVYRRHHKSIIDCFKGNYRKFEGSNLHDSHLQQDIQSFIGLKPITKAPRGFRIIVAGQPGSGKSKVAEKISELYGPVVVSARKVVLQAISSGRGESLLPYIDNLHLAPSELIGEAVVNRLKENDCIEKGWVLDGFPGKASDLQVLKDSGILPNRVIWLAAPKDTCWDRLFYRRHDPLSSRIANLKKKSPSLDTSSWIQAPEDCDTVLEERFSQSEGIEKDLKKLYGIKNAANPNGIFHSIESEGLGEDVDEKGQNPSVQKLFELVEGFLIRPVPSSSS